MAVVERQLRAGLPTREQAAAAAVVVATVAATLVGARHGAILSPDSAVYQSAAVHLTEGRGLVDYTGDAVTVFPPGVAVVLALFIALGASGSAAWLLLDVVALVAFLAAGWQLLGMTAPTRRIWWFAGLAAMTVETSLFTRALSEPLFLAVTAWFTVVSARVVVDPARRNSRNVALVGALGATAFLVRYAGVFFVLAALLLAAVYVRRALALAAITACSVPVLVIAANVAISGRPMGVRLDAAIGPLESTKDALAGAARVLGPSWVGPIAAVALVMYLVVVGVRRPPVEWLGFLAVGYVAFMVVSATRAPVDPLDPRLLSPAILPAIGAVAAALGQPARRVVLRRVAQVAGVVAAVAVAAGVVLSVGDLVDERRTEWNDPDLAAALQALDGPVSHSNNPGLVWLHTGRDAFWLPSWGAFRSKQLPDEMAAFEAYLECSGPVRLVWIDHVQFRVGYESDRYGFDGAGPVQVIDAGAGAGCEHGGSFGIGTAIR